MDLQRADRMNARPFLDLVALAAALWVLNFALTFHNVWPTPMVETRHELSAELALMVLGLAALARLRPEAPRRLAPWLVAALVVLTVGRYAEVTAPALYGRPVNLYWDARHVHRVVAMAAASSQAGLVAAVVLGLGAVLVGLVALHRWALGRVLVALDAPAPRRVLLALCGTLGLLFAAGHWLDASRALRLFSLPITATYWQQMRFLAQATLGEPAAPGARHAPIAPDGLAGVAGADVYLVFVESYGASAFDVPRYASALGASRAALSRAIERADLEVVSARVESPTFGGASWLAHTSLMTGVEVRDGNAHRLLLAREHDTLARAFARAGHRPVALMPGLRRAWPEGAFFGFERVYGEAALAYAGPAFGWWRIPDQFALARFDALEVAARNRQPLFVFFPTITTHMPFRPTPPYQADWERLLGDSPYDGTDVASSLARTPDWTDLGTDYVDALDYAYTWLAGYLERASGADRVLVVLGDHQPAASVSGPGASWDVPVHVIARREAVLDALLEHGFVRGLEPARRTLGPMHALTDTLTSAFASAPGEARVDVARTVPGAE